MGKLGRKIAIITGASKGIGAGIARVFTEEGACVVLAARGSDVLQFAEELQAAGREAVGFRCDVSDAQSCKDLVDFTLKTYGTIDILDCNAGICTLSDFLTSDDAWRDAHIDVNIKGVWNGMFGLGGQRPRRARGPRSHGWRGRHRDIGGIPRQHSADNRLVPFNRGRPAHATRHAHDSHT